MRTKRVLLALLVVGCAVSLAGCGMLDSSETGENVETTDTPAVEGTATETTPADQSTTGDDTSEGTPTQESTDTPQEETDEQEDTEEDRIPVVGGELGVDQDRVFSQLNTLLGTEVSAPQRIIVEETTFTGGGVALDDGLFSMLIDEEAKSLPGYSGTYSGGDVTMVTGDRGVTDIEATLAHEYVHHVQAEKRLEAFQGESVRTYEYNVIQQSLDEGGAVWVTNEYIDEYMNWTELKTEQISFVESNYDNRFTLNGSEIDSQIDYVEAGYRQANAAERFFASPYYWGSQYLSEQIDSTEEYFEMYENPPTTTEQLIHGYEPGEEEPVPMTLNTTELSGPEPRTVGRLGELTLRLSLFSELEETRAASAAAGWGNDTMIGVFDDEAPQDFSSLWTIKMDTRSDAEELRAAMEAYLDGRATEDAGIWFDDDDSVYLSLEHAGDRTVVLAIGSESFVGSITATSDGEEVSIGTEE